MLGVREYVDVGLGFVAILIIAFLGNKLGDFMFKKGLVRPFFVRGHRIHHRDAILIGLPVTYTVIASLILVGVLHVVSHVFWTGVETTFFISAACLVVDLSLDGLSHDLRHRSFLHHEFIYLIVPAYLFTHVLTVLA